MHHNYSRVENRKPPQAEKYPFDVAGKGALKVMTPVPMHHQTNRNKLTPFSVLSKKLQKMG